tara:strand:- start:934 stop:1320 length:387 start_codon:yes stop_codon:yes gene_type:complete
MFGIGEAVTAGLKVLDKFIPDPELKAKMEAELRKGLLEADMGQMEVNKAEAAHRSIFVAGWRPFIGWVCGSAFAMHFVGIPVLQIVAIYADFVPPLIAFDMESLLTVMLGILGLGGMRSFEKFKGITK